MINNVIDTSGLICPMPILTVKKKLRSFAPGTILTITTTDASSAVDFPHFFATLQIELMETSEGAGSTLFKVRV